MKFLAAITATVAILVGSAAAQGPKITTRIAEHQVALWTCQDHLGIPRTAVSVEPWALPKSPEYRRWVLNLWTVRHKTCSARLQEVKRQWNWQAFPRWVIDLARCESGINWYAEGSSQDGVFYSAFNISRSQYDIDAHHMGVRGWHEGPGVPSPYEQAMAVIGHMRLLGDGFTGRCHGIARSSWA